MIHRQDWVLFWLLFLFIKKLSNPEASISNYPVGGYLYRSWSEWTSWSSCSRSCGGGVSVRTRICRMRWMYHSSPISRTCPGETMEYKVCEKEMCPPFAEDFLSYQCNQRNGHTVGGEIVHDWLPQKDVDNPCELQCYGRAKQVVYSFGKVIDGTRCDSSSGPAICVNGRCTVIDCAGQLGTDNRLDMCGVCGGDNSTCVKYRNSYWGHPRLVKDGLVNTGDHYDYNRIATIPSGVTRILVTEDSDTNFLVLMDHRGVILVNGNWRVGPPDYVTVAGTLFSYNRSWDGQEVFSAPGPTQTELYVLVLGRGDVPTVHYEYWLSKKPDSTFPKDYSSSVKNLQILTKIKETKITPSKHSARNAQKHHYFDTYEGYSSYYDRNDILPKRLQHRVSVKKHPQANETATIKKETTLVLFPPSTTIATEIPLLHQKVTSSPSKEKFEAVKYRYRLNKPKLSPFANVSFAPTLPTERTVGSSSDLRKISHGVTMRPEETSELSGSHDGTMISSADKSYRISAQRQAIQSDNGKIRNRETSTTSQRNDAILKPFKKRRRKKQSQGNCLRCPRVKQQKKNFCNSDFVLRGTLLSVKKFPNETQYEVEVIQSYKNVVPILTREYLWTKDVCRCPRLRLTKEYILMGNSVVISGSREARLFLSSKSFVRKYNRKRSASVLKLTRDRGSICKSKTGELSAPT